MWVYKPRRLRKAFRAGARPDGGPLVEAPQAPPPQQPAPAQAQEAPEMPSALKKLRSKLKRCGEEVTAELLAKRYKADLVRAYEAMPRCLAKFTD